MTGIEFDENGSMITKKRIKEQYFINNSKNRSQNHRKKYLSKEEIKQKWIDFNKRFEKQNDIPINQFFTNSEFIGKAISKRNSYYIYKIQNQFLIITNPKPKINYNIMLESETNEIYELIKKKWVDQWFTMKKLLENLHDYSAKTPRLQHLVKNTNENDLSVKKKDRVKFLYNYLLNCMYVLVGQGKITLQTGHREIEFLNLKSNLKHSHNQFFNFKVLGTHRDLTILKNKQYFLTLKKKAMRGSIFLFQQEEIDELIKYVRKIRKYEQIDIDIVIDRLDYEKFFHKIYELIMDLNVRQDRDPITYFHSRVEAGLGIVNFQTHMMKVTKDGRSRIWKRS